MTISFGFFSVSRVPLTKSTFFDSPTWFLCDLTGPRASVVFIYLVSTKIHAADTLHEPSLLSKGGKSRIPIPSRSPFFPVKTYETHPGKHREMIWWKTDKKAWVERSPRAAEGSEEAQVCVTASRTGTSKGELPKSIACHGCRHHQLCFGWKIHPTAGTEMSTARHRGCT